MDDAEITHNREASAKLIYAEGLRLRDLQDKRVDDARQRSITVLSLVASAVVIVAGFAKGASIPSWSLHVAGAAVAVMAISAVLVHIPKGDYREGPNVAELVTAQYNDAHPAHQVYRDLGSYHYEHYRLNNRGVLKWINRGFTVELCAAGVAVVSILVGTTV